MNYNEFLLLITRLIGHLEPAGTSSEQTPPETAISKNSGESERKVQVKGKRAKSRKPLIN